MVADLIDIARGTARLSAPAANVDLPMLAIGESESAYYLRIPSVDRPGAFARVATILSEREISIEAVIQREQARVRTGGPGTGDGAWVPIVILTHSVREAVMDEALQAIQALPDVVGQIMRIRVEHFDEGDE